MSFKDTLTSDLNNIFFNEGEFAEVVVYYPLGDYSNGIEIVVIQDYIALDDDVMNAMQDNVIEHIVRVLVKAEDMPNIDDSDIILLDEATYYITNFYRNDNGVIECHLTLTGSL